MLSGKEIDDLTAVLSSTLNFRDLERYVHASTGDRLFAEFVSPGNSLGDTIVDLLNSLEERGQTSIFLAHVYDKRPQRLDVRAEIAKLFPDTIKPSEQKSDLPVHTAGAPQPNAPAKALGPGLQHHVQPFLDQLDSIPHWKWRLAEIERRVCRLELEGNTLGTGFLVGPDVVLTNWHVVEAAAHEAMVGKVGCRFNYELLPGKIQPGQLVMLQANGCIDSSPYSAAEGTGKSDAPLPTAEELDYALLRLTARVGEQKVGGAVRGWLVLPKAVVPLAADSPILTVQLPKGKMKLALDPEGVIGLNGNGTRLLYRTTTEPGSPVFTMDWNIIALHHFAYREPARIGQGVPIELIRQRIERNGFGAALGT